MSKRLQVILTEHEFESARHCAQADHLSVSQWVRKLMREARTKRSVKTIEQKQEALRKAMMVNAPTCDIDQMLREIEQGYEIDLPGL